jgi:hypothetical protein
MVSKGRHSAVLREFLRQRPVLIYSRMHLFVVVRRVLCTYDYMRDHRRI